jgi:hypothetical protein
MGEVLLNSALCTTVRLAYPGRACLALIVEAKPRSAARPWDLPRGRIVALAEIADVVQVDAVQRNRTIMQAGSSAHRAVCRRGAAFLLQRRAGRRLVEGGDVAEEPPRGSRARRPRGRGGRLLRTPLGGGPDTPSRRHAGHGPLPVAGVPGSEPIRHAVLSAGARFEFRVTGGP